MSQSERSEFEGTGDCLEKLLVGSDSDLVCSSSKSVGSSGSSAGLDLGVAFRFLTALGLVGFSGWIFLFLLGFSRSGFFRISAVSLNKYIVQK